MPAPPTEPPWSHRLRHRVHPYPDPGADPRPGEQRLIGISDNPIVILLLINLLLLFVGCFMDTTPAMMVLSPILLPVALAVALQVWLCKRRSRWLGLILPGLTLLASLLILLSMAAFTQVGASEVIYDEHGAVVEEHHAEHWEAFTGAELGAAGASSW